MYISQPPPVRFSQRCLVRITQRLRRCARRWLCHLWQGLKWLWGTEHGRKERSLEILLASTPEQHWPEALDALAREQRMGLSERSNPGVGCGTIPAATMPHSTDEHSGDVP